MLPPPQNLEAEEAVLGAVIIEDARLPAVAALLGPQDFYSPAHQAIFATMLGLREAGRPCDLVTLSNALREAGEIERVGGEAALIGAMEKVVSTANAEYHAQIVRARSERRKVIGVATKLGSAAYDLAENMAEALAQAQETLGALQGEVQVREADFEAVARGALAELEDSARGARWSTGLDWLDGITGGMGHDQGWIVTGKSGHCKTALALNIALAIMDQGGAVCFFRWEERAEVMAYRLASLLSRIPYAEVRRRSSDVSPGDHQAFRSKLKECGRVYRDRLWVYRGLEENQMESVIAKRQPWLCIYDTIQAAAMQVAGVGAERRWDLHVARLCANITRLRGRHRHTALLVSQLNSEGQERESRAIREDNDVSLDLYWPHKEDHALAQENIVVEFRKNRLGGIEPRLACHISPGTQRFGAKLPADEERCFLEALR